MYIMVDIYFFFNCDLCHSKMYIVRRTLYVPTTSRVPKCPSKHLVKAFLHAALSTIVIVTGVLCWVTSWLESDS